jgi:hypothetical protein
MVAVGTAKSKMVVTSNLTTKILKSLRFQNTQLKYLCAQLLLTLPLKVATSIKIMDAALPNEFSLTLGSVVREQEQSKFPLNPAVLGLTNNARTWHWQLEITFLR